MHNPGLGASFDKDDDVYGWVLPGEVQEEKSET